VLQLAGSTRAGELQHNDLTGGGSFRVEARADVAILVAERERVATE
jgi:hypothetical protein